MGNSGSEFRLGDPLLFVVGGKVMLANPNQGSATERDRYLDD